MARVKSRADTVVASARVVPPFPGIEQVSYLTNTSMLALEPKYRALLAMTQVRFSALPRQMPDRGIYLFSEGDQHLYVGRTNRIRQRLAGHCRPSSTHFSATFAFGIARQVTLLTQRKCV